MRAHLKHLSVVPSRCPQQQTDSGCSRGASIRVGVSAVGSGSGNLDSSLSHVKRSQGCILLFHNMCTSQQVMK
ncbi:hypothetical protein BV20DRAFT_559096 [Pilatotrama ljubarskyi]|nr:hypothetical protein BV20DRAFT_559096 [Pilatotrama ljubarskyi]